MQEQNQPETILPYDVVSLPSQGVFYKNNKKTVKITYLNASDENLLASSATQKGDLVNLLITRKLVDKDIVAEEMPDCDKEAILIFLRNTAFGPEYTISLKDPKTEKAFDVTIDLSVIKTRDLEVKLDENNEFDYYLEKSKKKVKLTFLTPLAQKELQEIDEKNKESLFNPFMTKQLEKMVKEIDGNRDPMTIAQYIQTMPIADSHAIKKIVRDNTPSLDLTVKSKTPSGEDINVLIAFGIEFFRPFYGI